MKCSIEMLQKGAIKKNPIPYPTYILHKFSTIYYIYVLLIMCIGGIPIATNFVPIDGSPILLHFLSHFLCNVSIKDKD